MLVAENRMNHESIVKGKTAEVHPQPDTPHPYAISLHTAPDSQSGNRRPFHSDVYGAHACGLNRRDDRVYHLNRAADSDLLHPVLTMSAFVGDRHTEDVLQEHAERESSEIRPSEVGFIESQCTLSGSDRAGHRRDSELLRGSHRPLSRGSSAGLHEALSQRYRSGGPHYWIIVVIKL